MRRKPSILYYGIETGCYYKKTLPIRQEYLDFDVNTTIFYQQGIFKAFLNRVEKKQGLFLPI